MLQGDTIRLKVNFKSFDGKPIDPADVQLTIYKSDQTPIEQIPITDTNKLDVGVYFYDYNPTPELNESFIFEFAGSINNKISVARGQVEVKFI